MWRWSGPTSLIAGTFVLFDSGWEPEDPGACCEDRQAAAIGRPIPSGVGLLAFPDVRWTTREQRSERASRKRGRLSDKNGGPRGNLDHRVEGKNPEPTVLVDTDPDAVLRRSLQLIVEGSVHLKAPGRRRRASRRVEPTRPRGARQNPSRRAPTPLSTMPAAAPARSPGDDVRAKAMPRSSSLAASEGRSEASRVRATMRASAASKIDTSSARRTDGVAEDPSASAARPAAAHAFGEVERRLVHRLRLAQRHVLLARRVQRRLGGGQLRRAASAGGRGASRRTPRPTGARRAEHAARVAQDRLGLVEPALVDEHLADVGVAQRRRR